MSAEMITGVCVSDVTRIYSKKIHAFARVWYSLCSPDVHSLLVSRAKFSNHGSELGTRTPPRPKISIAGLKPRARLDYYYGSSTER